MPPSHEAVRPGNRPARRRIGTTLVQETPVEKERRILARQRLNLGDQQFAQIDDPAVLGSMIGRNQGMSQGQRTAQNLKDNMKANILAAHRMDQDLQEHYAEQRKLARPRRQTCSLAGYSRMRKSDLVTKLAKALPKATEAELKKFSVKELRKVAKNHCRLTSRGGAIDDSEEEEEDSQKGKLTTSVYSRPPIGGEPIRLPSDVVRHIGLFDGGFENRSNPPQKPGAWAREGDDYAPRPPAPPGSRGDYFRYEGYQLQPSIDVPAVNYRRMSRATKKRKRKEGAGFKSLVHFVAKDIAKPIGEAAGKTIPGPVNPFSVGYDLGYNVIGPAILRQTGK